MKLKIMKLHPDAKIPHFATEGAAGLDLTAVGYEWHEVDGGYQVKYYTGLAFEIPKGFVGLLFPRSSVCRFDLSMANSVGVIDSDYRGEVSAVFHSNRGENTYSVGERCCQLVIVKLPKIKIEEVIELSKTTRGTGGYGSTGR